MRINNATLAVLVVLGVQGPASAGTFDNYQAAKSGVEAVGFDVEDPADLPCNNKDSCWGYLGPSVLEAIGKTVGIQTSSAISSDDYMMMCAGAGAGLLNAPVDSIAAMVGSLYGVALATGQAEADFGLIKLELERDFSDMIACSYIVY